MKYYKVCGCNVKKGDKWTFLQEVQLDKRRYKEPLLDI